MQSVPAEPKPGDAVQWTALYATPQGNVTSALVTWDLCTVATLLTTIGPVSAACLDGTTGSVQTMGQGETISGTMPMDACQIYGPVTPPPLPGQPSGRPVDPDSTGGYYQPVIMQADGPTLGETRISCGVAGTSTQQSLTFTEDYQPNANPAVSTLLVGSPGSQVPLPAAGFGAPASLKTGSQNVLTVQWPVCPTTQVCGDGFCGEGENTTNCPQDCSTPHGCQGAEEYMVFDPQTLQLVTQREGIHVSWFTTGGSLANGRQGVEGTDLTTHVVNTWTVPTTPGQYTLWVVLVDDRGGTGWESFVVDVTP